MSIKDIETKSKEDGKLTTDDLAFQAGECVKVSVSRVTPKPALSQANRYPLRGRLVDYVEPTEPVGEEDWEALK